MWLVAVYTINCNNYKNALSCPSSWRPYMWRLC